MNKIKQCSFMKRRSDRRIGFTLVELLIVIVIIAILAGMMMISTGSATDRAEATKILSDMRALKVAAIMYTHDNGWSDRPTYEITGNPGPNWDKSFEKYLDRSIDRSYFADNSGTFHVLFGRTNGTTGDATKWLVGPTMNPKLPKGVQEQFKKLARDFNLVDYQGKPWNGSNAGHFYMIVF